MAVNDLRKAVFLDKDGTIEEDVPYNVETGAIRLMPRVREGLRQLHLAGYELAVVSNQAGVAWGYFSEADLTPVAEHVRELLDREGIPLAGFYYCPHHPQGIVPRYATICSCRKPGPGLLFRAAESLRLDLASSWLVGDILDDVEAGRRAGCRTILLANGGETEWRRSPLRMPHYLVSDVAEAANVILSGQSLHPTLSFNAVQLAQKGRRATIQMQFPRPRHDGK